MNAMNFVGISYQFPLIDTVMLNWCKPLVEQFKGYPLCSAPADLSSFFEREVEYVRDFDKRAIKLAPKQAQQAFQNVLLLGLAETRVGLYSKFHDAAVYEYGYESQKAIHLAYMSVLFFLLNMSLILHLGLPLAWMQARLDSGSRFQFSRRISRDGLPKNPGIYGNWGRERVSRMALKSLFLNVKTHSLS